VATPPQIDETSVRALAKLVALELAPEHVPGVAVNLARTAQIAALVNEFPLPADDEQHAD
jgi:Asp-tRNA(Asn)/Glu-tRNA(Gln) amidotransferase C subunit